MDTARSRNWTAGQIWITELKQRGIKSAGTACTLFVLAVIGYVGHHTGWSLTWQHVGEGQLEHEVAHASYSVPLHLPLFVHYTTEEAIQKSGISITPVEAREVTEYIAANGTISYDKRRVARLSSRVDGTIWRIEKYLGDAVAAGDVLLVVEATEVGRLKAEFLSALISTETTDETLKKLEVVVKEAIPERQVRQIRAELRASRVRLLNAEQALVNLGINIRMEDYQGLSEEKRAAKIHFAGLPPSMADTFDPETTTSNLVAIVAPFAGVVTSGDVGIGEVVEPGKQLLQIADVSKMWICLEVQKEHIHKLKVGQQVIFRTDGVPEELVSEIAWISTEVDESTRTLQIRASIENRIVHPEDPTATGQRLLRANTFGDGRILVRTAPDAMVVPTDCIQSDGVNHIIFVKMGPTDFEGRVVKCGVEEAGFTEIEGPITLGDPAVHQGSHILKSQVLLTNIRTGTP